jgi:hypothetical protein
MAGGGMMPSRILHQFVDRIEGTIEKFQEQYLRALHLSAVAEVVFCGDGAP